MILVTGAPGWLGTRLVDLLVHSLMDIPRLARPNPMQHIRCLVQPGVDAAPLQLFSNSVEIVVGDINDPAALAEFFRDARGAILHHCAGVIHPRRRISELYRVNVEGTRNLLNAAQAAGVQRAISVSSISPSGFSYRADAVFDETRGFHPYMNYGHSKMLMEQDIHAIQTRGKLENVIIRATWFYGPGQPERQNTFFQMIRQGGAPILGSGNNRRSMTYIDNLCQVMMLSAITPAANGQTYWAADARPYTVNEIVDTVEELMENEFKLPVAHKRMRLPFLVSEVAMWTDWVVQRVGLYNQKLHVLGEYNKTIACSVAKAEKELGYKPTIDLREGMRRSIAWCIERGITL